MSKVTEEEFVDETFKSGGPYTSTYQAGSLYRTLDHFGVWEMLAEWKEGKQRVNDIKNVLQKYEELQIKYINPDSYAQAKITELERSLGNKEFLLKHLEEKLEALKPKPDPNPMPELQVGDVIYRSYQKLAPFYHQIEDPENWTERVILETIHEIHRRIDGELKLIWKERE